MYMGGVAKEERPSQPQMCLQLPRPSPPTAAPEDVQVRGSDTIEDFQYIRGPALAFVILDQKPFGNL